jgi:hypothetical protein
MGIMFTPWGRLGLSRGRLADTATAGSVLKSLYQTYSPKKPDIYSKGDSNLARLFRFGKTQPFSLWPRAPRSQWQMFPLCLLRVFCVTVRTSGENRP